MPTPAKTSPDNSARNLEMYDLHVRVGWSVRRIAARFGISSTRVYQVIKEVNDELRAQFLKSIRNVKIQHTQHLEELFFQAMQGWRRSAGTHVETTRKSTELPGAGADGESQKLPGEEVTTKEKDLAGDPRFLAIGREILSDIRGIWDPEMKSADSGGGHRVAGMTLRTIKERAIARLKTVESQLNDLEEAERN